jgi:hypothetical protein
VCWGQRVGCEPRRAKLKLQMDDYDTATSRVRALHAIVVGTAILIIIAVAGFAFEEGYEELARVVAHTQVG